MFVAALAEGFVGAIAALAWSIGSTFGKIACKNSDAGVLVAIPCNLVAIALKISARPVSAKLIGIEFDEEFADATLLSGLLGLAARPPNERRVIWLPVTPRLSRYFLAAIIRLAATFSPEFISAREPICPWISMERLLYSFKTEARFSRIAMSAIANSALSPWLPSLNVSDRATFKLIIWACSGCGEAATFCAGFASWATGVCGSIGSFCWRGGVFCKPKPSNNSLSLTVMPAYSPPAEREPLKSRSVLMEPLL